MKIELVEFYPYQKPSTHKKSGWTRVGTVHVYLIDFEMDLRGIIVTKKGKCFRFNMPHFRAYDQETGEKVMYPHVRFTNNEKQKALMDFLFQNVLDIVKEKINFTDREVKLHDSQPKLEK
ncbi:MAG: hypothetical protein PHS86_01925 [Syntrophaceae bacterium]|nr:hypothetical protein [Syntrophaceae bacterium]